ncbi:helix-turn-helix domain-containing protein [Caproiciproducens faecalis]|uniref:Helix-turn-helix transcriptional regulator n=1 Tax=Caproiciproducens faecalis TaxID=2820301 RepID=A0ABS7DTI7_9FIRM|nr:helix-turn-helix transcriptional regulator [Caproiciproducens faecalis]
MIFPERLKSLRTERHLTQQQVADEVGINRSLLTYYEVKGREPGAHVLCCLADYFHVTTDYLLGRSDCR